MATVEEFKLDEIEHAITNYDQAVCTLEVGNLNISHFFLELCSDRCCLFSRYYP